MDLNENIDYLIYSMIEDIVGQIFVGSKKRDDDSYPTPKDELIFEMYNYYVDNIGYEIRPIIREINDKLLCKIKTRVVTHTTEEW